MARLALSFSCIALVTLTACAGAQSRVIKQASFDHDCPPEKIQVLSEDTTIWAYKVDVCGKERKYRDLGNSKEFQFVDVTDGIKSAPVRE